MRTLFAFGFFSSFSLGAATLTWDSTVGNGSLTDGNGTWNSSLKNFTADNGVHNVAFGPSGSDVSFGSGATPPLPPQYTVTIVSADPVVGSVTFNSGAVYTIDDPTGNRVLTISSGNITANADAIISVAIATGVDGTAGLTKSGAGTLELNGGTTITSGLATVLAGRLDLNKPGVNAIGDSGLTINGATASVRILQNDQVSNMGAVNLLNGTLDMTTHNDQIASLNLTSGNVLGSGTVTASAFNLSSGMISANLFTGPINKTSSGTVILTGNNPGYVGAINVSAGILQIGAGATSGGLGTGTVNLTGGATLSINRSDTVTIGNTLTGGGKLENAGTGTVTLSGSNNDYTGGTTLTAGVLKLGAPGALPANGNVVFNGGALALNNQNVTSSRTLGALTLQKDSSIILGDTSTHGSIKFSTASRTGGTLSIFGWSPLSGPSFPRGGADDLILFSGVVTSDFLQHVQFYSSDNMSVPIGSGATIVGGQLEPVPEPVNVALGIFGSVFAGLKIAGKWYAGKRSR